MKQQYALNKQMTVSILISACAALGVHFEADTDRRKLGLPHRVRFLERSGSEPDYTHSVEVELRGQKHPDCKTVTFTVHVRQAEMDINVCINTMSVVFAHFCSYFTRTTY